MPEDTIVEVCSEEHGAGLVNVRFGDIVVAAFAGDLEARGERIESPGTVVPEPLDDKVRGINNAIARAMRARA